MLKWRIGDVTVSSVVEMEIPIPWGPDHAFLKQATPDALKTCPGFFRISSRPKARSNCRFTRCLLSRRA